MKLDVSPVAQLSKRDRVVLLLEHWQDFHETLHAVDHDHAGADPDAPTGMPKMYRHPSVVELRRCIEKSSKVMPVRTAHLMHYYSCEWRIANRVEWKGRKRQKREKVAVRERQRIIPSWIDDAKREAALRYIVAIFRGEVHIPSELLEVPDGYGKAA